MWRRRTAAAAVVGYWTERPSSCNRIGLDKRGCGWAAVVERVAACRTGRRTDSIGG